MTAVHRRVELFGLLAAFAIASLLVARFLELQPAGMDFQCFWMGGHVALTNPAGLYDFDLITKLQGFDFAPGLLRPYINPPSALLIFAPLSLLPVGVAYTVFMVAGVAALLWAGLRAGAPWWLLLLPSVAYTIFCGQMSLLLGGLVLLGLTFPNRPLVAGLLFAAAATLKPQLLILLPIGLAAQGRWLTIASTGAAGMAICALSAVLFGLQPWIDWFTALPRFHHMVLNEQSLLVTSISPYTRLASVGLNGAWAYLLAPLAAWGVWTTFRRDTPWPDQLIAVVGGALLISPYAMAYELSLLAPAVAVYLARGQDRHWMAYAFAAVIYAMDAIFGVFSLFAVLALPILSGFTSRRSEASPAV